MHDVVRIHMPPAASTRQPRGAVDDRREPNAVHDGVMPEPAIAAAVAADAARCPATSARTSALREFLAQAGGSAVASALRWGLQRGGRAGDVAGAALVASGVIGTACRAVSLTERALGGAEGRMPWACRLTLSVLPVAAAAAATLAVSASQAPAAVALFAGRLVERTVRDLTSHGLAPWLPRIEVVQADGSGVEATQKTRVEWGRTLHAMPRTLACTAIQCGVSLALAPAVGDGRIARAALDAVGSGLLEAARAVINHQATEEQACLHGLAIRPHEGQGIQAAVQRSADVTSLRQTLALPGDIVDLVSGTPASVGGQAALALALGTLKGLGEVRSAVVNLGRAATATATATATARAAAAPPLPPSPALSPVPPPA